MENLFIFSGSIYPEKLKSASAQAVNDIYRLRILFGSAYKLFSFFNNLAFNFY
jgi:hypothetical protein